MFWNRVVVLKLLAVGRVLVARAYRGRTSAAGHDGDGDLQRHATCADSHDRRAGERPGFQCA